ncbi:hypothetical protein DXT63_14470 [Thermoanaerobacteraceae bacterium SP2]|jgi:hypothetical protein|nr:hypothetical protein DXT63_14470 [Thermoanaerobacteraceae bacterium SP2]
MKGLGSLKRPGSIILIMGVQALVTILLSTIDESELMERIAGGLCILLFGAGCMIVYNQMYKNPNMKWYRLLKAFRIQRHDFHNHLQIIYTMIQLKKYDRVLNYINNIKKNDEALSRIYTLKDPELICSLLEVVNLLRQYEIDVLVEITDDFGARRMVTANLTQMAERFIPKLNGVEGQKQVKIILNKSRIELCSESLHEKIISCSKSIPVTGSYI